jgi:hypothetical protein
MQETTGQESTAANTVYTIEERGTITLAGKTFRVEVQHYTATGGNMVWLHGPRGGTYFLRAYIERGGDTGIRQVISWGSGKPLRNLHVVEIAGQIEEFVPGSHR